MFMGILMMDLSSRKLSLNNKNKEVLAVINCPSEEAEICTKRK
jgi:hypothetical protein